MKLRGHPVAYIVGGGALLVAAYYMGKQAGLGGDAWRGFWNYDASAPSGDGTVQGLGALRAGSFRGGFGTVYMRPTGGIRGLGAVYVRPAGRGVGAIYMRPARLGAAGPGLFFRAYGR